MSYVLFAVCSIEFEFRLKTTNVEGSMHVSERCFGNTNDTN